MKKLLSILMVLILLCCASVAIAENLYSQEIQFAEFKFGDTYDQIRSKVWVRSAEYSQRIMPTRVIADAANEISGILFHEMGAAGHFYVNLNDRQVAGHNEAQTRLYFTYKDDGRTDGEAILYAGVYTFFNNEKAVYDDLKTKLTRVYGTPWATGEDAEDIWGPLDYGEEGEGHRNEWKEYTQRTKPNEYTVWRSSVNNVEVVLKFFMKYDLPSVEIDYLWKDADQYFTAMYQNGSSSAAPDDLQGL